MLSKFNKKTDLKNATNGFLKHLQCGHRSFSLNVIILKYVINTSHMIE